MELEGRKNKPPEINLSALIDIVFILLIFVVLAANFQRLKGVRVDLPEAEASGTIDDRFLTVTVPVNGPIQLEDIEVSLDMLREEFAHQRERYEGLVLKADGAAAFERAVKVLAEAQLAGFDAVSIATISAPASKTSP